MDYDTLFFLIDVTICNAWLLYQIEFKKTFPTKKHMTLYEFKRNVSEVWMSENEVLDYRQFRHAGGKLASRIPKPVRFDAKGHWPQCTSGYNDRHNCALCKKLTNVKCLKCHIQLCCSFKRNCFLDFHTTNDTECEVVGSEVDEPEAVNSPEAETV